ncbi:MAG: ATP-dependent RecD-like DNA helicase [Ruminococcaceae bacterium]|nr:ATP-dependent RecD-like DNA helicase [Oscillospiraceae bacterium]
MSDEQVVQLQGTVENIVFRNDDNGWTVLELDVDGTLETIVGTLPYVQVGESLRLQGEFVEHHTFGRQFKATACESSLPTDSTMILRYLASGAVRGIGPSTAVKIVDRFGADSLRILEEEPQELAKIKGISLSKAREMGQSFASQFGLREVVMAFAGYGLTPNEAMRCWKMFGYATLARVKANPYLLCTPGLYIGFERADRLAMQLGADKDDGNRLEAGVLYVLRHNTGNGHTCLPADKVIPTAARLLGVSPESVETVIATMKEKDVLRAHVMDEREFLFLPHLYEAELFIARRLPLMSMESAVLREDIELRIDAMERNYHICYEEKQREAMIQAVSKGILILTGGPGTGKTTTLRGMITLLESMGELVSIAAPTGRAAKRIAELTGRDAKTLHRLLEVKWDESETPAFERNERNQLEADAVIVDEMSMVDTLLFESLLRAMKTGCRLILVGDTDQLPSIGAGSVLHDLIDSQTVPVVQLTQVFRQALESRIVSNAHRIVAGRSMELDNKGDCFFLPRDSADATAQTVLDLCTQRLTKAYGYTVFNGIQVLCAGRKGDLGTGALNGMLQSLLNPSDKTRTEITIEGYTLRVGDKVMHTRNNYDIPWTRDDGESGCGVFNGDIGILEEINLKADSLMVRYEDRVALYTRQDAKDLELAYAITVHKSQGSEFDAVVMPVFRNVSNLCYRNLLYTAVTRAKKMLVLVGSLETIQQMIDNDRKTLRYTGLRTFLMSAEGLL